MYLNQFTNTKKFWYAHCARTMTKRLQWIYVTCLCVCVCVPVCVEGRVCEGRGREENNFNIFFSSTKWHEIYYSILFQPAKWVLQGIIIQKMSQFHKKLFSPSLSFTASVPLQNYLQVFKYIHPLLSIESH